MLKMNSVAVALALLVLSGCAVGSLAAQATVSFQNDVNGYQGCKSTDISTLYDIGAPGTKSVTAISFEQTGEQWRRPNSDNDYLFLIPLCIAPRPW